MPYQQCPQKELSAKDSRRNNIVSQSLSVWNERSEFKDQQDQKFTYKDQRRSKINLFHGSTDQSSSEIKVQQDQRSRKSIEINYFQITDQKFKVQLFTDQITKSDLVRKKPSLI